MSIKRFTAIAKLLALTIAIVIHTRVIKSGILIWDRKAPR
jgi:hypothetical protein